MNRATSENIKSMSSVELFPSFVRFLRETPETGGRHLLQHLIRYASVHQAGDYLSAKP